MITRRNGPLDAHFAEKAKEEIKIGYNVEVITDVGVTPEKDDPKTEWGTVLKIKEVDVDGTNVIYYNVVQKQSKKVNDFPLNLVIAFRQPDHSMRWG